MIKKYLFHTERRNHSWVYTGEEEWLDSTVLVRHVLCNACGEQRRASNPISAMDRKGCTRASWFRLWLPGDHVAIREDAYDGRSVLYIFEGWSTPTTARLRGFAGGLRRAHASEMRRP